MTSKRKQLIEKIISNLNIYSDCIKSNNMIGFSDESRESQIIFAEIFNLVFDKKFEDLDRINKITNNPAIDLGDIENKLSIQITADSSTEKIHSTIKGFIKKEYYNTYDRLIIFIIGKKGSYPKVKFDTEKKFNFSKEDDIWDIPFLIKNINSIEDVGVIKKIDEYLKNYLDPYINPERIFDEDIKNCILILKRDLPALINETPKKGDLLILKTRDENYIEGTKNKLNKISWEFYKKYMKGDWKYNDLIFNFLGNPINKELVDDYTLVCDIVQKHYNKNKMKYTSLDEVFKKIFEVVNFHYDDKIDNLKKLRILIHNMYFNCDIGTNKL